MADTSPTRRIVIAGGSGFLGLSLAQHLHENNFEVVILSRNTPRSEGPWTHVAWDGRSLGNWKSCLDGAYGMVNLAGRTVDCIKTPDHQDEILRSRVESTRVLGQALRAIDQPPPVWVQMGTAHIFGDPPEAICTEQSAIGVGLAPDVAMAWEEEFAKARLPSQRGIVLRTSFVVGRDRGAGGGALDRLSLLTRLGLGGRIGTGKQGFSWIHELDLNRLFQRALIQESMHGVYIASAPNPVSQIEFMRALREAMGIRFGLPAFAWMVRLGAPLLLRTDPNLALYGRYVRSDKLREEGFAFQFPDVGPALQDITRSLS
ncbi:epimerase [Bremerella alba]|uniref:Epimerase family protein n=1 Tax=Bremerella alba TaxID=980252 RepID=A0A7V8V967_9BACT|nr:DUF1731 domain-containing protein [Bremerella alba]MBA2117024.1 Epimerase family protein [Bremerella alba]